MPALIPCSTNSLPVMTAKNGNISLILKFVLAAAVVAGGVVIAWQRLSDTAVVAPVTRGKAVSAVSGSVWSRRARAECGS